MSLFQVKGWNVKGEVAVDTRNKSKNKKPKAKGKPGLATEPTEGSENKPNKRQQQKKQNRKDNQNEKKHSRSDVESENSESEQDDDDDNEAGALAPLKPAASAKLTPLQQKMMMKLSGSRFRWINEQLYTTTSKDALQLIKDQPELFDAYHEGFRSQVQSWPENPVDVFVNEFKYRSKKPVNAPGGLPGIAQDNDYDKKVIIADMGCGEAQLAKDINAFVKKFNKQQNGGGNKRGKGNDRGSRYNKLKKLNVDVHSFDLKKGNDLITVADIKNVPLPDESCSVVIFCLALMGTNFLDFINEAYRILAPRGELWIAEIKSRFNDSKSKSGSTTQGEEFVNALKLLGFFHKRTDVDNKMFIRFEFFKPPQEIIEERKQKLERRQKFIEVETEKEELLKRRGEVPEGKWLLKPCIYKRR